MTDPKSVDSYLYDFAWQGWCRLNRGADVITGLSRHHPCRFSKGMSRYLQDICTCHSCTAQRVLRTIFIQTSKPKYACLPRKIVEVWSDRFCDRYDWWRWLQPKSSVSPVWFYWDSVHHQRRQWGHQQNACRQHTDEPWYTACVTQSTQHLHLVSDITHEIWILLEDFGGDIHALVTSCDHGGIITITQLDVATTIAVVWEDI